MSLISGPGRSNYALGNLIFRYAGPTDAILKVYRRRKSRWNQFWAGCSHRWFERKRGVTPAARCATERTCLSIWGDAGFGVPRVLSLDRPTWIGDHPALWMEHVAGERLDSVLADPGVPAVRKQECIAQLAAECGRRHREALERNEIMLIQEHATTRHVLVSDGRTITFDLEHAYQPDYPIEAALAHELASTLRSLWIDERFEQPYIGLFLEAHAHPEIVRESCRRLQSRSMGWALYRFWETRRRGARSKTETMWRVGPLVGMTPR